MNYAKSTSDVVSKLSGKYVHKDKLKRDQERKRKRDGIRLKIIFRGI